MAGQARAGGGRSRRLEHDEIQALRRRRSAAGPSCRAFSPRSRTIAAKHGVSLGQCRDPLGPRPAGGRRGDRRRAPRRARAPRRQSPALLLRARRERPRDDRRGARARPSGSPATAATNIAARLSSPRRAISAIIWGASPKVYRAEPMPDRPGRLRIDTGSVWEPICGYSRAVRSATASWSAAPPPRMAAARSSARRSARPGGLHPRQDPGQHRGARRHDGRRRPHAHLSCATSANGSRSPASMAAISAMSARPTRCSRCRAWSATTRSRSRPRRWWRGDGR